MTTDLACGTAFHVHGIVGMQCAGPFGQRKAVVCTMISTFQSCYVSVWIVYRRAMHLINCSGSRCRLCTARDSGFCINDVGTWGWWLGVWLVRCGLYISLENWLVGWLVTWFVVGCTYH
jgi:hypothetical protein